MIAAQWPTVEDGDVEGIGTKLITFCMLAIRAG
jgi:hypothetical protein